MRFSERLGKWMTGYEPMIHVFNRPQLGLSEWKPAAVLCTGNERVTKECAMFGHHSHHHGHIMTALIDWEHAHDELIKASLVVLGIIMVMVLLGYLSTMIDTPQQGTYHPLQYHYIPYY